MRGGGGVRGVGCDFVKFAPRLGWKIPEYQYLLRLAINIEPER